MLKLFSHDSANQLEDGYAYDIVLQLIFIRLYGHQNNQWHVTSTSLPLMK